MNTGRPAVARRTRHPDGHPVRSAGLQLEVPGRRLHAASTRSASGSRTRHSNTPTSAPVDPVLPRDGSDHGARGCHEHGIAGGRRGGAALRARPRRQRHAAGAGAEGLPAHSPEARRKADRGFHACAPRTWRSTTRAATCDRTGPVPRLDQPRLVARFARRVPRYSVDRIVERASGHVSAASAGCGLAPTPAPRNRLRAIRPRRDKTRTAPGR